jgi:hypothetical protein
MRTLAIAAIIAALAAPAISPASAQGMAGGKRQRGEAPKTQTQSKKKVDDKDYNAALKQIPNVDKKPDPWGNLR